METKPNSTFAGAIPQIYNEHLVPLIFEFYASDLANRLRSRPVSRLLEIAAGTGVVTRALASALPASASIVATDLNQPMLDQAAAIGTSRPVEWRQADALNLPFPDNSFDAVVCQFGVMFFPDKPKAFSEARRVLKPGGICLFNVWDSLQHNEIPDIIHRAVQQLFPADPPQFLARAPYAYYNPATIADHLRAGGYTSSPKIDSLPARSRAPSARSAAMGFVQGTPLRNEIESRNPAMLAQATDAAEQALISRFGRGPIDAKIQAHVVTVER